jgi:ClpP class serine protease
LINTPLAISQDKLEILSSEVAMKLLAGSVLANGVAQSTSKEVPEPANSVMTISIFDSLVAKGGAGESGMTSYEGVKKKVTQCIEAGASKIVFYIDSPGGEVAGLFGLTSFIADIPKLYGVETVAFTDGYMTSAAYAIGAACQTVYATESSNVGSIGVIMSLVDMTKADESKGISYTILRSKELKATYNPHETLSEATIAKYSEVMSELDSLFNLDISKHRPNLSLADIVGFKADSFLGSKALALGLIDGIVASIDEVTGKSNASISSGLTTTLHSIKGENMITLEEAKAKLAAAEAEVATLRTAASVAANEAVKAERTRCLDILAAGTTLKIGAEQVTKRITAGTSKDDSLDVFTAIAEALGTASSIDTSTEVPATLTETNTQVGAKLTFGDVEVSMNDIVAFAKGVK